MKFPSEMRRQLVLTGSSFNTALKVSRPSYLPSSCEAERCAQVHESKLVQDEHEDQRHEDLQRGDKGWVGKVVDAEDRLVEERDGHAHEGVGEAGQQPGP